MEPVTFVILMCSTTLLSSIIGVTIVSNHISERIDRVWGKYRTNKKGNI